MATFNKNDVLYMYKVVWRNHMCDSEKLVTKAIQQLEEAKVSIFHYGSLPNSGYQHHGEAILTLTPIREKTLIRLTDARIYGLDEREDVTISAELVEWVLVSKIVVDVETYEESSKKSPCGCPLHSHHSKSLVGFFKGRLSQGDPWQTKTQEAVASCLALYGKARTLSLEVNGKRWHCLGFGWEGGVLRFVNVTCRSGRSRVLQPL